MLDKRRFTIKITVSKVLIILYFFVVIVLPNASTLSRISKGIYGMIAAIYVLSRRRLLWNYYITWLGMISFLAFASIGWANSRSYAISGAATIFFNAVCTFFLIQLISDNSEWKTIVFKCCALFSLIRVIALIPSYGLTVFTGLKNVSDSVSYNAIGFFSAFGAVFCILLIKKTEHNTILWELFLGINILLSFISMSRKALLYLIIPITIYYLFTGNSLLVRIKRICILFISIFICYLAIMNIPILYNLAGKGIESIIQYFNSTGSDSSAVGRSIRIEYGIGWFLQKPILGYGARNFNFMFAPLWSSSAMVVADNNYVDILVSFGVVGFVVYYYLYLKTSTLALKQWKSLNPEKIMFFGVLITLLICDYGVSSYIYLHSQTFLAIAVYGICECNDSKATNCKRIKF